MAEQGRLLKTFAAGCAVRLEMTLVDERLTREREAALMAWRQ